MSGSNVSSPPPRTQVTVDAGRLWAGGLATACVAALLAVAGVIICQDVLDVRLVRPALLLDLTHSFAADYAITAFALAVVATGVAHALALTTPRPRTFFAWIVGLATVCGVAAPFAFDVAVASQVATAGINLALGVCTGSLIGAVMSRTTVLVRGQAS
jgi:hypothetical protein